MSLVFNENKQEENKKYKKYNKNSKIKSKFKGK